MSKAFVNEDHAAEDEDDLPNGIGKESENSDDSEDSEGEGGPRVTGTKNYITPQGMARLKAEVHELLTVERPKIVETVAWAASNGDRSENADYIYGKRRLREIDRRLRFLQKRIDRAEVVDPALQRGDKVLFGATVTVLDEDDCERVYSIVGIDETDAKAGLVSWLSPIGQALLQGTRGDTVVLKTPKGEEELEIIEVVFRSIGHQ